MIPRFLHRWYAYFFGYFWKACPACGRMFGGHEFGDFVCHAADGHDWIMCRRHDRDLWRRDPIEEGVVVRHR